LPLWSQKKVVHQRVGGEMAEGVGLLCVVLTSCSNK
jgi:hypothetical protein